MHGGTLRQIRFHWIEATNTRKTLTKHPYLRNEPTSRLDQVTETNKQVQTERCKFQTLVRWRGTAITNLCVRAPFWSIEARELVGIEID